MVEYSGGGVRELGIFGKCKQLGAVLLGIHALLTIQFSQFRHKFYGHSLPSCPPWWLLVRCLLHHLFHLPHQCGHWIPGNYFNLFLNNLFLWFSNQPIIHKQWQQRTDWSDFWLLSFGIVFFIFYLGGGVWGMQFFISFLIKIKDVYCWTARDVRLRYTSDSCFRAALDIAESKPSKVGKCEGNYYYVLVSRRIVVMLHTF